jgi:8-oxo-dGTP pyrophosphatase MutT (NUDIX family)
MMRAVMGLERCAIGGGFAAARIAATSVILRHPHPEFAAQPRRAAGTRVRRPARSACTAYNSPVIDAATLANLHLRLAAALAPPRLAYRPFWVERHAVGWIDAMRAARLATFADVFEVRDDGISFDTGIDRAPERSAALADVARALAAAGELTPWRDERYAVAPAFGAPPLFLLERAAARFFGIHTYAAHVNGLVAGTDDTALWFARRSPDKAIDAGLLDNLVGGGIAAGTDVLGTVIKEAWEEAGLPAPLARRAIPTGVVDICREQFDGLQRETIFVHDLWLPADFVPSAVDGEVVEHRRVPLPAAAALIAEPTGPNVVTADASLVVLDCLMRHGAILPDTPEYLPLAALRHPPLTIPRPR